MVILQERITGWLALCGGQVPGSSWGANVCVPQMRRMSGVASFGPVLLHWSLEACPLVHTVRTHPSRKEPPPEAVSRI